MSMYSEEHECYNSLSQHTEPDDTECNSVEYQMQILHKDRFESMVPSGEHMPVLVYVSQVLHARTSRLVLYLSGLLIWCFSGFVTIIHVLESGVSEINQINQYHTSPLCENEATCIISSIIYSILIICILIQLIILFKNTDRINKDLAMIFIIACIILFFILIYCVLSKELMNKTSSTFCFVLYRNLEILTRPNNNNKVMMNEFLCRLDYFAKEFIGLSTFIIVATDIASNLLYNVKTRIIMFSFILMIFSFLTIIELIGNIDAYELFAMYTSNYAQIVGYTLITLGCILCIIFIILQKRIKCNGRCVTSMLSGVLLFGILCSTTAMFSSQSSMLFCAECIILCADIRIVTSKYNLLF